MTSLPFPYRFTKNTGFTLIELVVVLAIVGILSGMGISSSMQYNKTQVVDSAAKDFANTLQIAKSRAFTQVKPVGCTGGIISYVVTVTSATRYTMRVDCVTTDDTSFRAKTLTGGVTLSPTSSTITFPVLTGGANLGGNTSIVFTFSGNGVTRTVTVYDDARIVTQ